MASTNEHVLRPDTYVVDRKKFIATDIKRTCNWWGHFRNLFNCRGQLPNIHYYECNEPFEFDFSGRTLMHFCRRRSDIRENWSTGFSVQLKEQFPDAYQDYWRQLPTSGDGPIISVDWRNYVQIISIMLPDQGSAMPYGYDDESDRGVYDAVEKQLGMLVRDYKDRQNGLLQSHRGFCLFSDEENSDSDFTVTIMAPEAADLPLTVARFHRLLRGFPDIFFQYMFREADFPGRIEEGWPVTYYNSFKERHTAFREQRMAALGYEVQDEHPERWDSDEFTFIRAFCRASRMRGF